MEANPTEGGTATDVTDGSPYAEGTVVDILAEPDPGWVFLNWESDAGGTFGDENEPDTTFTMPGNDVTVTANFYEPEVDPGKSSASWADNEDGTGTMSLIVRDQEDNPMPGFGMDDIAIRPNGTVYTLNDLDAHPNWTVDSFIDDGNGNYTVVLNRYADYDSVWDVIVDGIVIEEGMDVEITGNVPAGKVFNQTKNTYHDTIQLAIDAADAGDTLIAGVGTFEENVNIDKRLILIGSGSGDNPDLNTIVTPDDEGTAVVTVSAAGESVTERLMLSDLHVAGTGTNSHGIRITSVGSFITFDNVVSVGHGDRGVSGEWNGLAEDLQFLNCTFSQNAGSGLRTSSTAAIRGLTLTDTTVSENDFGAYIQGRVTGVAITGGNFDSNQGPGTSGVGIHFYRFDRDFDDADKLPNILTGFTADSNRRGVIMHTWGPFEISEASISNNLEEGLTFNTRATGPGLIKIREVTAINNPMSNLWAIKFGDTAPISLIIEDCILSGSTGVGFPGWGYGLYLYAAHRPWDDVSITGCTMNDNTTGIYMRALSATASITGASITSSSIEGNDTGMLITEHAAAGNNANSNNISGNTFGVQNNDTNVFDATNNWWGDESGPTHADNPGGTGDAVSDNVNYDLYTVSPF